MKKSMSTKHKHTDDTPEPETPILAPETPVGTLPEPAALPPETTYPTPAPITELAEAFHEADQNGGAITARLRSAVLALTQKA